MGISRHNSIVVLLILTHPNQHYKGDDSYGHQTF